MTSENKIRANITSVFHRPIAVLKELSAGSLVALMTAAGFLPLFPGVGVQFGLDPQAAQWLGSIGTNILAGWVQHFWEEARKKPPKDQDELLMRLSSALQARMTESPEFRADVARFVGQIRVVEAAREALEGRDADQAWFLINLYTELIEHRQEFADRLSGVESALEVLGYKADAILRNLHQIKQIANTFPTVEQQIQQFEAMLKMTALWPATLPYTEPYYSLPERDTELEKLMGVLRDPKGRRIIAVDGLGGLGKTAMAVEIGRRCLAEGLFERVVGESAKQVRLVGETIEKIPEAPAKLGFEELLDAIVRQLGRWDIPTMKPEEKRATLRYLLQRTPYLIIVDNLETAENARGLVMELQRLLDGSRAIVTSRPQIDLGFVYRLPLEGLSKIDSLVFLREEARSTNCPDMLNASERQLRQIYKATGGAPLAMKLVVGQVSKLPLDVVLDNLQKAKGDIYRFIYLESWNLLSLEAQKLLIYMGTVVTTCAYDELASVGIADDEERLQEAIKEAMGLSLLKTTETVRQKRYAFHPLTGHFVNSDLPEIWREQGLLQILHNKHTNALRHIE